MKQYSSDELDSKIHGFMQRKMGKFPELENERYYIERKESTVRGRASRLYVFPTMKLGSQH